MTKAKLIKNPIKKHKRFIPLVEGIYENDIKSCHICKKNEPHKYSSMCQGCIDDGWRWNGFDFNEGKAGKEGYYNENDYYSGEIS
tara:strand:- start:111 stop:365 length:255 start_codon:yes stop_codon:yes gene_type:complete